MADNAQKTPYAVTFNRAADARVRAAIALEGKALPCQVVGRRAGLPIVTVGFLLNTSYTLPRVELPVLMSPYVREPVSVGDQGVVFPIDTYLGGVSGLGGGVADLSQRANLATLVFVPVGSTRWTTLTDPDALTLFGGADGKVNLAGEGGPAVARVGDKVSTPAGTGIIISGSTKVSAN